jgi:CheY-like chemotaxis protein
MAVKRILVVEDDVDIRHNLHDILESEGYECAEASDGKEALALLKSSEELPTLILLDLMMPNMNGFEFRAAQELDPALRAIPVVIMTADAQIEAKRQKIGAKDFLHKPVELTELLDTIQRNCG